MIASPALSAVAISQLEKSIICLSPFFTYPSPVRVRCAGSPAATRVSHERRNGDFDTQRCKTGEMKTYLSPGLALYFQIRRGMGREIPGLPVRRTQTGLQ